MPSNYVYTRVPISCLESIHTLDPATVVCVSDTLGAGSCLLQHLTHVLK
jgi:hypothetical protein